MGVDAVLLRGSRKGDEDAVDEESDLGADPGGQFQYAGEQADDAFAVSAGGAAATCD